MRALCARMGSGHRPGSPSVTAQCDSRAFAGAQKCSGGSRAWRCFRCPELSGRVAGAAAACATRWRVVPAGPAAPTEGGGGQELPARCCQLLLSKAACGLSLLRGLAGVCTVSLFSSLSAPPGPPWQHAGSGSRLWRRARPVPCCSQTPGAHGSLALPLCRLSPLEVSRSAEPPPWSDSPLPLRTVGGWQGPEPGGVYAQGPSLAQQPLLAPGEVLNP